MTTLTEHSPRPPSPSLSRVDDRRFRPEVQGVRAIAVLLVVVYHLKPDLIPGGYVGVDVFFVISGFLITSMLIREVDTTSRFSLTQFYSRRIRRILPAATAVLLVTALASFVLLPWTRMEDTARQLVASALYVENWLLAFQAVDYLAASTPESPVQHYWSLSIEEQFYVLWPLLILGWVWLRRRWSPKGSDNAALVVTLLVTLGSLAFSVWFTAQSSEQAYFVLPTRIWELSIGGFLAFALARFALPHRLRWPLGWAGVAAIAATGLLFDDGTPFPSYTALLPVLGAVALIAAGHSSSPVSTYRLLSSRPAQFVGDISYALYLWHWPLLILALNYTQEDELGMLEAPVVLVVSVLLAWLTKLLIEDPVRHAKSLRALRPSYAFALACIVLVGAVGGSQYLYLQQIRNVEFDPQYHIGPQALVQGQPSQAEVEKPIYPSTLAGPDDLASVYDGGDESCHAGYDDTKLTPCVYGPDSADASKTVAMVGDSHAAHWVPALRAAAQEHNWRVVTYTKSACAFTATMTKAQGGAYEECREWNEQAIEHVINESQPDAVFTSASVRDKVYPELPRDQNREVMADGMAKLWDEFGEADIPVFPIRDTPRPGDNGPDCVERNSGDLEKCGRSPEEAIEPDPQVEAAELTDASTHVLDLTDSLCTSQRCDAVVGNVLVYRDTHHITATYSRMLGPALYDAIDGRV